MSETSKKIDFTDDVHVLEGLDGEFNLIELERYTKPSNDMMGQDFVMSFTGEFKTALVIFECPISQGIDISLILNDSNDPRFRVRSENDGRFESSKMATQGADVVFWVDHQGREQTMWLRLTDKTTQALREQMLDALNEFNRPLMS